MKKQLLSLAIVTTLSATTALAQTTSTFENIALPTAGSHFLGLQTTDGDYTFTSGNLSFLGKVAFGGTYQHGFNVSNVTDTTDKSYNNSWSVKSGSGHNNSANYLVAYVELGGANWDTPVQLPVNVTGNATNNPLLGVYINNTTWVYDYTSTNYGNGDSLTLIIKGYENGVELGNAVQFTMAKKVNNVFTAIKDWTYLDLSSLDNVDSLSITMSTTDLMTPLYFAMDDVQSSDGVCQEIDTVITRGIFNTSADFVWENKNNAFGTRFDVAVDQSNTDEPATSTIVNPQLNNEYQATGLAGGTQYYLHVRPYCWNQTAANWYKLPFKTTGSTSVNTIAANAINIYPNPANDFIQVKTDNFATASIFNTLGQQVLVATENMINISSLSTGTYIIKVTNQNGETATSTFSKN